MKPLIRLLVSSVFPVSVCLEPTSMKKIHFMFAVFHSVMFSLFFHVRDLKWHAPSSKWLAKTKDKRREWKKNPAPSGRRKTDSYLPPSWWHTFLQQWHLTHIFPCLRRSFRTTSRCSSQHHGSARAALLRVKSDILSLPAGPGQSGASQSQRSDAPQPPSRTSPNNSVSS